MLSSIIFAWLAVLCVIITGAKFLARKSGNKKINDFLRRIHLPSGYLLIIFGLLHGLLAGNSPKTDWNAAEIGSMLFTLNWGSLCFLLSIILALTFLFRKSLKKYWYFFHRLSTILLIFILIIHIWDVGIKLPSFFITKNEFESTESTESTEISENTKIITFSGAELKDGVYIGSAPAYKKTLTVSVTVEKGQVSSIEITENYETPGFLASAIEIIDDIIAKQSLEVDAVSGATYSSAGILNAVNNALQDAVASGELLVNDIDLTEIRIHR